MMMSLKQYVYATAAVILALSLGYWLIVAYCPEENMEIKKFNKSDDKIKRVKSRMKSLKGRKLKCFHYKHECFCC